MLLALCALEGDVEAANRHLDEALSAAHSERLIHTIVEQGPLVHKLLMSSVPDPRHERFVGELIAAASHVVAPVRMVVTTSLVEPLSARELTVLRYLSSRLTYREIAAALYVSLNTLKTHVRSVYRKLEVASRADAVDVGRRLGVI